MHRRTKVLAVVLLLTACSPSTPARRPPFDPERARQEFVLEDGFQISLFASEPRIASPVAMDFDENGRLFVVEMPGYPLDTRPTGRIQLLEDTNGDGIPDRSTVFADSLVLPTGVMRWKKGVIVTAAPDVWYLADEDGDGKAERREKILTGFAFTNPQHTVNTPVFTLDNWISLAHEGPAEAILYKQVFGDTGSAIRFVNSPGAPTLALGRHAIRFRPDTHELDALSGSTQYGHSWDEWGHYFTLDNSNHFRQQVIDARYVKRNPELALRSSMQNISDHGSNAKVFAITRNPRFELLTEPGEFTSACCMDVYLGGAFPRSLGLTAFVSEPAQNLVHRDVLTDAGATFVAHRAQEGREFLASTDNWFRPVSLTTGPDGALYVVDYYRGMIEHPEWASTKVVQNKNDMYAGQDRGRVWRITPAGRTLAWPRVRLGTASDDELVAQLANPNIWWRRTAQRLLVQDHRTGAVPSLVKLATNSPEALGRLHALYTLEGLGALDDALIEKALADAEPGVRENAIRLAEPRLTRSSSLVSAIMRLASDSSAKVRYQLLLTLGNIDTPESRAIQDRLLRRDFDDAWMQVAALSASPRRAAELLDSALSPAQGILASETKGRSSFLRQAAQVVGASPSSPQLARVLTLVTGVHDSAAQWWRAALLDGLARGADSRETFIVPSTQRENLVTLAFDASPDVRRPALKLLDLSGSAAKPALGLAMSRAKSVASDSTIESARRADAIRIIGLAGPRGDTDFLVRLLDVKEPEEVRIASVQALSRIPGADVGRVLLERWSSFTGPVRSAAADALLADPARTRLLVAALRSNEVQAWGLTFGQKRDLIMNEDPQIRAQARPILESSPAERDKVVAAYQRALEIPGDAARGSQVFLRVCSRCHRVDGQGADFGPDLGSVRNKAKSLLLVDILEPSRAIAQGYESYVVETTSGERIVGLLRGEASTSAVVLRQEGGADRVIQRSNIQKMYTANSSAMPADLEKLVSVEQMADLLEFLTKRRK